MVRADVMRWLAGEGAPASTSCSPTRRTPSTSGRRCSTPPRAAVVVIESDREIDPGNAWLITRSKRYGSTVVTFVARAAQR